AGKFVRSHINGIKKRFKLPAVESFLDAVTDDLIHHRLTDPKTAEDFVRAYQVNLVGHHNSHAAPVVSVTTPNLGNLVGKVDREISANGMVMRSDHLMIKPGALFDADGGYLILEAQDILMEPAAWTALLRTLKTGQLEIASPDFFGMWGTPQLRPEPIPIDVKVVLVGDPEIFYLLDVYESRFSGLFKVLVDFGDSISRDDRGFRAYANVITRLVERDKLLHFDSSAVARLIEHGARICGQSGRLTSRFGRIADIAREASFIAAKAGKAEVGKEHIIESVARSKRRADLPARHFRRLLAERTLMIDVGGQVVGQVNGLAVTSAGPMTYGFPSRITASIGPGSAGAINIERESELSGSVHTKGFLILSGLLRYLLRLEHPMAFSASIAFEQSYGGVDGDSASGAEFCCLLSSLTELPIRQDLAMTGAVDQKGNILPIGAVNEKIEGFYDACKAVDFSGTQGVIIPSANAAELMLRDDVVDSIKAGEFDVFAIHSIDQALAILLDRDPGELHGSSYDAGTVLGIAQNRAHHFWNIARKNQ
ncbi:MAG: AAA family ATPase, partial [Pseudomonadales bacterium]